MALDIAAGLRVRLKLGLQGFNLLFGQSRPREVFGVFFVIHYRLVIIVDHVERRMSVNIAINWVHHRRVNHCRVVAKVLLHWHARMASEGVWMVDVVHDRGR